MRTSAPVIPRERLRALYGENFTLELCAARGADSAFLRIPFREGIPRMNTATMIRTLIVDDEPIAPPDIEGLLCSGGRYRASSASAAMALKR